MGKIGSSVAVRALAVLGLCLYSFIAPASTIPVDLTGVNVIYDDIVESSHAGDPEPLFGAPSLSGDSLRFYPSSFYAQTTAAGGVDLTDGLLKFRLVAKPGFGITTFKFEETGAYSLAGSTNVTAQVSVGVPAFAVITAVDGNALASSITVAPTVTFNGLDSNGQAVLTGPPNFQIQTGRVWSATLQFDLAGALALNGITGMVTELQYTMDNVLAAGSGVGNVAAIDKKYVGVDVGTQPVPEPATWALLAVAGLGFVCYRRRKSA